MAAWQYDKSRSEAGFTLIEVAIAVAILGVALTTLIGLHTRMLDNYYQERNRTKASIVAQYVMSRIEAAADAPEVATKEGDLEDLLEDFNYFETSGLDRKNEKFDGWTYRQEVTSVDLPVLHEVLRPFLEDALRRIDLDVRWGPSDDEVFRVVYFASTVKSQGGGAAGLGGEQFGTSGGQLGQSSVQ